MKGTCAGCGETIAVRVEAGRFVSPPCKCVSAGGAQKKGMGPTGVPAPSAPNFSNAKPTDCGCGRRHPSKMQARVCRRLHTEAEAAGLPIFQEVRFPLLGIAPRARGRPHSITIDFVIVAADGSWRCVDAKSEDRVSRDWRLRVSAFETTYGAEIEEVDE